ncbi:MAG: hypothetical protein K0S96_1284, partial [Geminicoccaceae bacterium]|nr:hypothetical protein [Geminicoccaceae bacterium]
MLFWEFARRVLTSGRLAIIDADGCRHV